MEVAESGIHQAEKLKGWKCLRCLRLLGWSSMAGQRAGSKPAWGIRTYSGQAGRPRVGADVGPVTFLTNFETGS